MNDQENAFADRPPIFLIDDDDAMQVSLRTSLSVLGFVVECFPSTESFWNRHFEFPSGIFLVDFHMPNQDGLEFLRILRSQQIQVPVIIITGSITPLIQERCTELGAVAVLEKPFGLETLLSLIQKCLVL